MCVGFLVHGLRWPAGVWEWFLRSGCFSTKSVMLPTPLKTSSVFKWRKKTLAPRTEKTISAHIFFSGKNKFGKFGKLTLISPETRHYLHFSPKLLVLRKATYLYCSISTTIVLILNYTARFCPFLYPSYI